VPVLVCFEEEALGVLSPRNRAGAAAAEIACLREKGVCRAAAQHADYHALPFSGFGFQGSTYCIALLSCTVASSYNSCSLVHMPECYLIK
jgi:hypothetical protein